MRPQKRTTKLTPRPAKSRDARPCPASSAPRPRAKGRRTRPRAIVLRRMSVQDPPLDFVRQLLRPGLQLFLQPLDLGLKLGPGLVHLRPPLRVKLPEEPR